MMQNGWFFNCFDLKGAGGIQTHAWSRPLAKDSHAHVCISTIQYVVLVRLLFEEFSISRRIFWWRQILQYSFPFVGKGQTIWTWECKNLNAELFHSLQLLQHALEWCSLPMKWQSYSRIRTPMWPMVWPSAMTSSFTAHCCMGTPLSLPKFEKCLKASNIANTAMNE